MSGWRPLTFFPLVHQQALCGQSKWEHQTLLPDTAAERVSVLWGHPEPRGWPPPPPGHSLDWLHPWWRRASWHCAHPLARAKETVNTLFQLRHNHTFSSVQASVFWVEKKSINIFGCYSPMTTRTHKLLQTVRIFTCISTQWGKGCQLSLRCIIKA